jgi:hypothetical protein
MAAIATPARARNSRRVKELMDASSFIVVRPTAMTAAFAYCILGLIGKPASQRVANRRALNSGIPEAECKNS